MGGVALYRIDKIGDEVGTTLVLILYLAPRLAHALLLLHRLIIEADAGDDRPEDKQDDDNNGYQATFITLTHDYSIVRGLYS